MSAAGARLLGRAQALDLALLVLHAGFVALEELPDLVAHGEDEEEQEQSRPRAQPAVELPADQGHDGGGQGQLEGRGESVTEAPVHLLPECEIASRSLAHRQVTPSSRQTL